MYKLSTTFSLGFVSVLMYLHISYDSKSMENKRGVIS